MQTITYNLVIDCNPVTVTIESEGGIGFEPTFTPSEFTKTDDESSLLFWLYDGQASVGDSELCHVIKGDASMPADFSGPYITYDGFQDDDAVILHTFKMEVMSILKIGCDS